MKADRDVVELSEDVSHSPLWNPDLAPTPLARRTWSTYHIAALWIGMSVVITTYTLASGLMQQGMSWWQAMLTILLGNAIVLIPMNLNAHAGTKYGVSFPVLCRASFGVRGANVPAILRALVACGWFGIQTWIGGLALDTLLRAAWPGWAGVPASDGTAADTRATTASPPIQVWMPNQPQATKARSSAGTLAPRTPNAALHSTGNDTPYLVPAWAFSIIGISTIELPSRIVSIAWAQVMPCCISPEASV